MSLKLCYFGRTHRVHIGSDADLAQEVPESLGAVKRAVDALDSRGRFIVTGSVRARLMPTKTWPGTGRMIPLKMYPFTQGELMRSAGARTFLDRLHAADLDLGQFADSPTIFDYFEMAEAGGFPEALAFPEGLRPQWFEGYVAQLVGRDVEQLAELRNPQAGARFFRGCPAASIVPDQ